MNEKVYKTMTQGGIFCLVLGIVTLAISLVSGILMLIQGARLLKGKKELTF